MGAPDSADGQRTPHAVEQARAWLAGQTGRVPASMVSASMVPASHQDDLRGSSAGAAARRGRPGAAARGRPSTTPAGKARPDDAGVGAELADPGDPEGDPESVARAIALRKLTAQARTRQELDQALLARNVPDQVAASVLDRLEEVGLVDDEAFAQEWVASRQRRRHLSRSALRRELQGKGIVREYVDAALATVHAEDELAAARALAAKKANVTRGLDPLVRQRRLAGALARRGFGAGTIATVLGELEEEPGVEPGA